ncbi:MAG: hypothetical protein F6K09_09335 [Merismopedia sp. SIO2A8]|nr:hypothetical protein [Symploca sp. SIO2B6]NET48911.1 hypothetical protein [Merismopedia sp. SIO2A8]
MNLFNHILSAIDNPAQQASSGQLSNILSTVGELSTNVNADPSTVQGLMSIVGKYVRPALQQKREVEGEQQAQAFINQFSGINPNNQAVELLLGNPQIQQLVQEAQQRTGLNASLIQNMLPTLVPLVLNLLQTGATTNDSQGSNTVLNAFLDADGDGDIDIADAMKMAGNYLG